MIDSTAWRLFECESQRKTEPVCQKLKPVFLQSCVKRDMPSNEYLLKTTGVITSLNKKTTKRMYYQCKLFNFFSKTDAAFPLR